MEFMEENEAAFAFVHVVVEPDFIFWDIGIDFVVASSCVIDVEEIAHEFAAYNPNFEMFTVFFNEFFVYFFYELFMVFYVAQLFHNGATFSFFFLCARSAFDCAIFRNTFTHKPVFGEKIFNVEIHFAGNCFFTYPEFVFGDE